MHTSSLKHDLYVLSLDLYDTINFLLPDINNSCFIDLSAEALAKLQNRKPVTQTGHSSYSHQQTQAQTLFNPDAIYQPGMKCVFCLSAQMCVTVRLLYSLRALSARV